ncbi:MAG TPA: protein kinase [Thermoanaerobaculia bacterium]|nr:protein kinase [Thermoanaerobaculia bacterium]
MSIAAGSRLGPYEVVSSIGAGGMGEVWRAKDTRLDREVAIKILPPGLAENDQFLQRFDREARAISSLNHPNICTLFDVGHENETHFLVMELIEGESLATLLSKGRLPLDQVIRYGAQIAEALSVAHRNGIIHRDLKPGNVMITKSGAKLLDFGLARSAADSPVQGLTEMPTQARPLTAEGTILGTFQYMAPEQLEGLEADARTDIFALGALVYEMSTGQRAFQGSSKTSLIAAIVAQHPEPISSVTKMTPPALDHVVNRCLEKDPDDRWQSAHDVASELRWISEAGSQAGVARTLTVRRRNRERIAWTLAALTAAGAITAGGLLLARSDPPRQLIESSIDLPDGMRLAQLTGSISISPDATTAAFVSSQSGTGGQTLWLRPLSSDTFRQLTGTENASRPFWSADSRKIGFFADGKLKVVDTQGGTVTILCEASAGRGGAWMRDGTIIVALDTRGPLFSLRAEGGAPEPLTRLRPGDKAHLLPIVLPDGNNFLFAINHEEVGRSGIYQSSLEEPETILPVAPGSWEVASVAPDILLLQRENSLLAQRHDSRRAQLVGNAVTVTDRFLLFAAAADGTLLLKRNPNLVLSQLVWVDRLGREEEELAPPALFFSPRLSRDERRLAVDISDPLYGSGDIWIFDLPRGSATRLTYDNANESSPQWSPDDRQVYYAGYAGAGNIFEVPAGGTGEPQTLVADERDKRPTDVSSDGQWIVFDSYGTGGDDIWVWSASEKAHRAWLATPFREKGARFSPDGKWIAYQSDESGRWEIYVRAFPDSDRKWMLSSNGGIMPVWSGDGKELFYVSPDDKMNAVTITPGSELDAAAPEPLFDAPLRFHGNTQYEVTSDGRRFLLNRRVEESADESITLLQNWQIRLASK